MPIICRATRLSRSSANLSEGLTGHFNRPELRKVNSTVAADSQEIALVDVAVKLDADLVAGSDDVLGRHRHVGRRGKRRRDAREQVVSEGFQCFLAEALEREPHDVDPEVLELRRDREPLFGLQLRQARERDGAELRHFKPAEAVEAVGIPILDAVAQLLEFLDLFRSADDFLACSRWRRRRRCGLRRGLPRRHGRRRWRRLRLGILELPDPEQEEQRVVGAEAQLRKRTLRFQVFGIRVAWKDA